MLIAIHGTPGSDAARLQSSRTPWTRPGSAKAGSGHDLCAALWRELRRLPRRRRAEWSATDLANPEYQALIDDASLRERHCERREGHVDACLQVHTAVSLTDTQIDAHGPRHAAHWYKGNVLAR